MTGPESLKPIKVSKTRKTGLSHLLHQIRKMTGKPGVPFERRTASAV